MMIKKDIYLDISLDIILFFYLKSWTSSSRLINARHISTLSSLLIKRLWRSWSNTPLDTFLPPPGPDPELPGADGAGADGVTLPHHPPGVTI